MTPVTSYLDSSFLLKAYLVENGSDEVANFLRARRPRPLINLLTDVEVASALSRELSDAELQETLTQYERDKMKGVFQQVEITPPIFSLARELILQYGKPFRLRSLDALHLATAKQCGVRAFATYDGDLATVAYRMGFVVIGARP